jgi:hypothetical protein
VEVLIRGCSTLILLLARLGIAGAKYIAVVLTFPFIKKKTRIMGNSSFDLEMAMGLPDEGKCL